jgi:hypothetical protein
MKKLFALLIAFTLVFSACEWFTNDDGDTDTSSTTGSQGSTTSFQIQNQSAATLFNVVWNGYSFNDGNAISTGSNSQIDKVQEGGSYIFFNIMGVGSEIALRTRDWETITNQNKIVLFTNNTVIVEVGNPNIVYTIESFLNRINNPEGLYLPSHDEILLNLNAIGGGINNIRILSYQLMQNLLWNNVLSGTENDGINLARDSKINIEVGYTGPVSGNDVSKVLGRLFINFTNVNIVVSGGMTFPLPSHLEIQQAVIALDGAGTTHNVVVTNYIVNGSYIFDGYEIDRPHGAIIEITVRYTTTILTQARVRTEVIRIFATAGFNNVTVDAAHW